MASSLCRAGTVLLTLSTAVLAKQLSCSADEIPVPEYRGTKVLKVDATEVRGSEDWGWADFLNLPYEKKPISYCNVTLTYTHPGWDDNVNVYIALPFENWNERFVAMGGGGFSTAMPGSLFPPVANGYASASTDGGHTIYGDVATVMDASSWALTPEGNIRWPQLQDFAAVALDDLPNLAKAVITSYYGKPIKYSYWNGCSTGGRQGLLQAQRFPKNFDGIIATAPAINWDTFVPSGQWGHVVMREENYFPPPCELAAIREKAIEACDEIDGVKDGVISAYGLCKFDAQSVVGEKFDCFGDSRKISKGAAAIANKVWEGSFKYDRRGWYGLTHETPLAPGPPMGGHVGTVCDDKNKNCKSVPFPIGSSWVSTFLQRDKDYDVQTMSREDYFQFIHRSQQWYKSILGTDDPDLSEFKASGGKMITWHGTADELIYVNGSSSYYERVLALDPKAADYYRYFEAPGIGHCAGGVGPYPSQVWPQLVDWVENGKVPEVLNAATVPMSEGEAVKHRPLCLFPKVASYKGGPPNEATSYECADSFGSKKASDYQEHTEL